MPPTRYLAAFCIGAISSFYLPEQGNVWAWCVGLLLCAGLAFCLRRVAWQQKAACTFLTNFAPTSCKHGSATPAQTIRKAWA